MTCQISVTNADTFGDALRIDRIVDTIQRAAGPQVNTIPLPLNLPPDLRGTCVGGTRAGLACGCPGGTCGTGTPQLCAGGSRSGLQCDCPGGTCTTILPGLGQQVVVVDRQAPADLVPHVRFRLQRDDADGGGPGHEEGRRDRGREEQGQPVAQGGLHTSLRNE